MPSTLRLRNAGSVLRQSVATSGATTVPSGPLGSIRPTMTPQIGPLFGSGHGAMRPCALPDAVSHVPITDDCCAEVVAASRPSNATSNTLLILVPSPTTELTRQRRHL